MTRERIQQIKAEFIDEMPATWPEGYRQVVIELIRAIESGLNSDAQNGDNQRSNKE